MSTCTVYTVTPDDHYYPNTTCHHCHNLQHYLLNITKYFTSNTQLLFLPGLHHLHTHLIIQNVHNISLIGSTANGTTLDTVIQCNSSVGILMNNVTNLTVRNVTIRADCEKFDYSFVLTHVVVTLDNCFDVTLSYLNIHMRCNKIWKLKHVFSFLGINVFGKFNHISCNAITLKYYELLIRNINNYSLSIDHFQQVEQTSLLYAININAEYFYDLTIQLANISHQHRSDSGFLYAYLSNSACILYIINCNVFSNSDSVNIFEIEGFGHNSAHGITFINCSFLKNTGIYLIIETQYINVKMINCTFDRNLGSESLLFSNTLSSNNKTKIVVENTRFSYNLLTRKNSLIYIRCTDITLVNCIFDGNSNSVLQLYRCGLRATVIVKNSQFVNSALKNYNSLVIAYYSDLLLEGLVTFHAIINHDRIIELNNSSTITMHSKINFSNNIGYQLIVFKNSGKQYIILQDPSIVSIYHNHACNFATMSPCKEILYSFCTFQYYSNRTLEKANFLIEYYNNQYISNISECHSECDGCHIMKTNCHWLPGSVSYYTIPLDVNNKFIKSSNNSKVIEGNNDCNKLCACNKQSSHDCSSISDLGYLYPGEALSIFVYHKDYKSTQHLNEIIAKNEINKQDSRPCVVPSFTEWSQTITINHCSKVSYNALTFLFGNWCELFLKLQSISGDYHKRFYIRKLSCPPGFLEIHKICQCDPKIVTYGITQCNINNQTVVRPSNTWITATTYIPYSYHFSKQCRFYYCLPHSSHLNFSTPNSQCQFNRSGLLCGHCQQGLITVFSSSQCHHCSNVYLFLIIPIAIAGIALVITLFILNITVTDGTINGFILLANIISINTSLVFPRLEDFAPTYTFISFANLDLGIQTCFYNGMDDYVKMWLQLAFPFYLIFIATLIIITSRYSTMIQRLTARRALPVLATLFLLSYTKIL